MFNHINIVAASSEENNFSISREELREFQGDSSKYRMASFYKKSRLNLNLLVDEEGNPKGGKWSFDEDNRKKFPKDIELPTQPAYKKSKHHDDIIQIIEKYFSDHPGLLDNFWFPVTRDQAKNHFDNFLKIGLPNLQLSYLLQVTLNKLFSERCGLKSCTF